MDSAEEEEVKHNKSKMGFQENGQISYGLRENPKKSWKFSGFNHVNASSSSMQENQCKVCGKNFESQRALFGHMRHHSGKGKTRIPCKQCGKAFLSLKSLANHTYCHSDNKSRVSDESGTSSRHDLAVKESLYVKKKRSRRKRYNFATSSSISSLNESLSITEIDQQVEHAARCLMMLSRGVRNRGGLNSFKELSDNDSVTFEIESLNGNECFNMKKPREGKLDSLIVLYEKRENQCVELCSGIESFEKKKIDLEVSIERFYKGGEFEMHEVEEDFIEKGIRSETKFMPIELESSEDFMKQVELEIMRPTSSKKVNFDALDAEFGGHFSNNVRCTTTDSDLKCKTCSRMFGSRRALAGHQRMHGSKKQKHENCEKQKHTIISPEIEAGCELVKLERLKTSIDQEMGGGAAEGHGLRESKKHKCPICSKDFATIQALGGHKRVHMVKNSKSRLRKKPVFKQEHSEICDELDLNIPIMPDEEDSGAAVAYQSVVRV
ncbi:hypothetical protein ACOSQ2_028356 [Xanthoceras sorbifolium]|uniref:C2H2-type domain-containing protein n=1 Tax=Xanthoceras sorbifolium TaxID=99658 RepID=A0ABQ8HDF4_9ROSI|nr:hypothetical protein JRO89_XS12G0228500 [Xanthoceras sorbifolium]